MIKTTVYLAEATKRRLAKLAHESGRSEAELIREGVDKLISERPRRPTYPLFTSGDLTLAERVDEELAKGFGQD